MLRSLEGFPLAKGTETERGGRTVRSHKWAEIKATLKPETRAGIEAGARELAEELHLAQLRRTKGLTQEAMAELLGVSQAEVSKTERRAEFVDVPIKLNEGDLGS